MKYTKEQRLDIVKENATHKMKAKETTALYGVSIPTISIWARDYKIQSGIYHKNENSEISNSSLDKIKNMTKEELTDELIKSLINQERTIKKGYMVKGVVRKGIHYYLQQEFQIVLNLSKHSSIQKLCRLKNLNRSSFYKWKQRIFNPSDKAKERANNIILFKKYPSHGYKWLNAIIRNETCLIISNVTAHKCCKFAGILSKSNHYRYKKTWRSL